MDGSLHARALSLGAWLFVFGIGLGCSEYIPSPEVECLTDLDCTIGSVCSLDTNSCVPEELPPRSVLAFDISTGVLRTELHGCDPEVSRELGGSELRVAKRSSLFEGFDVRVQEVDAILNGCTPATCDGVCDPEALTCTRQLDANIELGRSSRLELGTLQSPTKTFIASPEIPPAEGELPPPVNFSWSLYDAIYDPLDPESLYTEAVTRLRVQHNAENSTIGDFYRALGSVAEGEVVASATDRCMRSIRADIARVRTLSGTAIGEAGIQFLYDEPIATSSTVIGSAPACSTEGECAPGWMCDEDSNRCGLDLTRTLAASTQSHAEGSGEVVGGFPPAYLYTYCEEFVSDVEPLTRQLLARVKPPDSTGLPTVDYLLNQDFQPGMPDIIPPDLLAEDLCLPNWRPPHDVAVALIGTPVALTETELGVYACCATDCLPSNDPEVEPTPPPNEMSCSGFDSAVFETLWINDEDGWLFQGCAPTSTESGASGRYVRNLASEDGECPVDGCSIQLTPGDEDEMSRNYTVSIEQPEKSVFRSQQFNVTMLADTVELPTFELEPRVLLRGSVRCDDEDCSTTNAVVAAEQLRTNTGEDEIPGPFSFEARVNGDGEFLLPVDPGLYAMTAYPAPSEPGAPAAYRIVDLREDSPLVENVGGVPTANLDTAFALSKGVLVRVQLRDFDASTTVTPIDTGSWTFQDNAADFDAFDLNAAETCLTSSVQGCAIRRVRATDTPLPLLLAGQFQFTTRDRGSDSCPEG